MHVIGTTQKDEALKYLPEGTKCELVYLAGCKRFVVKLPSGIEIARERSSLRAWNKAKEWMLKPENGHYKIYTKQVKKDSYKKK